LAPFPFPPNYPQQSGEKGVEASELYKFFRRLSRPSPSELTGIPVLNGLFSREVILFLSGCRAHIFWRIDKNLLPTGQDGSQYLLVTIAEAYELILGYKITPDLFSSDFLEFIKMAPLAGP